MTEDALVFSTLTAMTGLPGTKFAWAYGSVPPLPWFVYYRDRKGEFIADNDNYFLMPRYKAELYIKENDPELVSVFEDAVSTLGPYKHRDVWLDSENCTMHTFTFTLTEEGA